MRWIFIRFFYQKFITFFIDFVNDYHTFSKKKTGQFLPCRNVFFLCFLILKIALVGSEELTASDACVDLHGIARNA